MEGDEVIWKWEDYMQVRKLWAFVFAELPAFQVFLAAGMKAVKEIKK